MPAKISTSRQAAYLKALATSGNATLAAERARVSREWAYVRRGQDAEFDAACREAVAVARERLSAPHPPAKEQTLPLPPPARGRGGSGATGRGSNRPPRGWRFQDGEELLVQRGRGRRVQVRRARARQWTPRIENRFLATLAATCNVSIAASEAGMSAASAYYHRRRWAGFAQRWHDAIRIAYPRLEAALIEGMECFMTGRPLPEDAPVRVMSVAEVIQALNLNKFAVKGIGGRPGRRSKS